MMQLERKPSDATLRRLTAPLPAASQLYAQPTLTATAIPRGRLSTGTSPLQPARFLPHVQYTPTTSPRSVALGFGSALAEHDLVLKKRAVHHASPAPAAAASAAVAIQTEHLSRSAVAPSPACLPQLPKLNSGGGSGASGGGGGASSASASTTHEFGGSSSSPPLAAAASSGGRPSGSRSNSMIVDSALQAAHPAMQLVHSPSHGQLPQRSGPLTLAALSRTQSLPALSPAHSAAQGALPRNESRPQIQDGSSSMQIAAPHPGSAFVSIATGGSEERRKQTHSPALGVLAPRSMNHELFMQQQHQQQQAAAAGQAIGSGSFAGWPGAFLQHSGPGALHALTPLALYPGGQPVAPAAPHAGAPVNPFMVAVQGALEALSRHGHAPPS
jgi:hypothetical protein